MKQAKEIDRETLESLADRAAEDGEHSVVAACQVLMYSGSSEADRRDARKEVRAFLAEISG